MQYQALILLSFSVLIAILSNATAQTWSLFGCPEIQGVDYINYEKINGTWYEYSRSPRLVEDNARCITFEWGTPIQGMQPVKRMQIDKLLFSESQSSSEHNSTITGAGKGKTDDNFDYTILEVDYDNYMSIYSCQNLLLGKLDIKFILTRERFPSSNTILKAQDAFSTYDISTDNIKETSQTDCPKTWEEKSNLTSDLFNMRG